MRVLFIVQGEGRGHLTQAISLAQLLEQAGHQVIGAWVNTAAGRPIPPFFTAQFKAPTFDLAGPQLIYHPTTQALDLLATLWGMLRNVALYGRSLTKLRDAIEEQQPDLVVNFFELLGGLTYAVHRPAVPMVCIAHQCMGLHPTFPFPKGRWLDRFCFKALIRLTSWGAYQRLGLSFDEQPDSLAHRLCVVPPLLRQELTSRQRYGTVDPGAPILAYTTQPGLQTEIMQAHQQCPDVPIDYFHSQTVQPVQTAVLRFRPVDGQRYLDAMQYCRAVMTTAGFESVCEALYLGKPVQMRPMSNHFEQACNALDGQRIGAGIATTTFDLPQLLSYAAQYDGLVSDRFRAWHTSGTPRLVTILEQVAAQTIAAPIALPTQPGVPSSADVSTSF